MSFLQNLGRSTHIENITITTENKFAASGTFSVFTTETIADVIIQNLTNNACFLMVGTEPVTATTADIYLAGGASLSLASTAFIHFSVLRAGSSNVSLRVTGVGRARGGNV